MRKFVCQITFEIPDDVAQEIEEMASEEYGEPVSLEQLLSEPEAIALQPCNAWLRVLEQYVNHMPDFVREENELERPI